MRRSCHWPGRTAVLTIVPMSFPTAYEGTLSVPLPDQDVVRANVEAVTGAAYDQAQTLNVVQMFAGTEGMFEGVIGLVQKVFSPDGIDDPRNRQLIILRAAVALGAPYEWQVNAALARNVGLSDAEIDAAASEGPVTAWPRSTCWSAGPPTSSRARGP